MPGGKIPNLSFDDFFCYNDVKSYLESLVKNSPNLAKLDSLGESREGREVYCLTLTDFATGAPENKPAFLIHGNIHASELSGTHAALYTARQLLEDHSKNPELLRQSVFYIVPRLNPDGAEWVVKTAGAVRSRTDYSEKAPNCLYQKDIDGNGLVLDMIWEHPDGSLVQDPKDPRLLIERTPDSPPPYYRKCVEGEIINWDGSEDFKIAGRSIDWNRQWGYEWRPEQGGAGDFPYSEPEMRHIANFIHDKNNIYAILGYHNGPAGVLRPPSSGSDDQLEAGDLRVYEDLAESASNHTGFPIFPVYTYHSVRSRHINLYGHFPSTGYYHFGLFVMEFELGMIYDSAGFDARKVFGNRTKEERWQMMRNVMKWWDSCGRPMPLFHEWKPFNHPQLGKVLIGGIDRKYMSGPWLEDLKKNCAGTYAFTLEYAQKRPRLAIEELSCEEVGDSVFRLRARVANRGEFPTHISNRGKKLTRLKPVRVDLSTGEGVGLLSRRGHYDLGHLKGITGSVQLEWFLKGAKGATCALHVSGGAGGSFSREIAL